MSIKRTYTIQCDRCQVTASDTPSNNTRAAWDTAEIKGWGRMRSPERVRLVPQNVDMFDFCPDCSVIVHQQLIEIASRVPGTYSDPAVRSAIAEFTGVRDPYGNGRQSQDVNTWDDFGR